MRSPGRFACSLWLSLAGLCASLAACTTTTSSGPMAGPPLTRLSIVYDAPPPRQGPIIPDYVFVGRPLPPQLEASIRFTLPSLLATHGVQVAADLPEMPDAPLLEIYLAKLVKMCNGLYCTNSAHIVVELTGAQRQSLWTRDAWIDDDSYDAPGQKEMLRRLVADMSRDQVIPAAVRMPQRSLVIVTDAPDPAINVRNYDVRFSRSGTGEDFKLISDRTLRDSLSAGLAWHPAGVLAEKAGQAATATHSTVNSLAPYPVGLATGCDDSAHGKPEQANADVVALLRRAAAKQQASYGLFLSARPLPAEDPQSPLNDAGLFIADSVDDSGLMKFKTTWRGAAHYEANLVTPWCAVFYDAAADAAIFQAWRPIRPADVPAKYYEHLDGIGEGFVPSLVKEFDANLGESLDKTLAAFIEQMTP